MMKITYLCLGTSLALIPVAALGQCVATQDCATLGYTESSCAGGNGVKCPFGNKWVCFQTKSEIKQEVEKEFCEEYGFAQTCTGANQTGGSAKACNGKYIQCDCASGYEWKDGACVEMSCVATDWVRISGWKLTTCARQSDRKFVAMCINNKCISSGQSRYPVYSTKEECEANGERDCNNQECEVCTAYGYRIY